MTGEEAPNQELVATHQRYAFGKSLTLNLVNLIVYPVRDNFDELHSN